MNITRPLVLAATLLTLIVSGCSQPSSSQSPVLEPQFGTPTNDRADAVVNDSQRGYIYAGGVSATSGDFNEGNFYLRRYDQNGSLAWKRLFPVAYMPDTHFEGRVEGIQLDAAGNIYLGWSRIVGDWYNQEAFIWKLNSAGTLLYKLDTGTHLRDFEVDAAGNLYVAGGYYGDHPEGANERFFLRKYSPQAQLMWERLRTYDGDGVLENPAQAIPAPNDIGLASDGSLYASGYNGNNCCSEEGVPELSKYSNAGVTLWEKPGFGTVTAAGLNFYLLTPSKANLQKYDSSGVLRWQRMITGFSTSSLAVDAKLNLYLAGTVNSENDYDFFVRKYTPAGAVSWTYVPKRSVTDEYATGISAKGSSNVYVAGAANGTVNGKNSGSYDAFLLRLNAQGQKVWSR